MFQEVIDKIKAQGDTIQISVDSDRLVPHVDQVGDKRVFSLSFGGTKYPCCPKGWTSWAARLLTPGTFDARKKHGLIDESTGRMKRWSTSTIRKFLDMTPAELADKVVKSWWERHDPTPWHVVKYADTDKLGSIRFIGSNRYRMYKHVDFLADLSKTDFSGMVVRTESVTEDLMVLRVTGAEPLPVKGIGDVYAGFNLLNSENGSSSISIRHLIYDLICTNGMMVVFDDTSILSQRHSGFDVDAFRSKVHDTAKDLKKVQKDSTRAISGLLDFDLDRNHVDAVLEMYKERYNASEKLITMVDAKLSPTDNSSGWQIASAITSACQSYGWADRMEHEASAGKLLTDLRAERHLMYLKEDEPEGEEAHV
ncbi:MAG: DUF932 domain-containing protein [Planctomycetota bacterium]|jgi:hypothetical protein